MQKKLSKKPGASLSNLLFIQTGLVISALGFLLLAPNASRPMMLIPMAESDKASVAKIAAFGDRKLLGNGPVDGSIIILGSPPNPITAFINHGVLTIAVSYSSCSGDRI